MKLIKKTYQNRRDFEGIYKCEGCGYEEKMSGYDDRFFHDEATPNFKCKQCGKSTNDLGLKTEYVATKYPDNMVV